MTVDSTGTVANQNYAYSAPSDTVLPEGSNSFVPPKGVEATGEVVNSQRPWSAPSDTVLPEGSNSFVPPKGVEATGEVVNSQRPWSAPSDTVLPEGGEIFKPPKGVVAPGTVANESRPKGNSVYGSVTKGGADVPGRLTVVYAGRQLFQTTTPPSNYIISYLPDGVDIGESVLPRGRSEVIFQSESGAVATEELSGKSSTKANFRLNDLKINVVDVNGEPVPKETVLVDGFEFTTGTDGTIQTATSGTAEVTGLRDSLKREASVDGGSASITLQFAGIKGKVRGSKGVVVSGATVFLKDSQTGQTVSQTKTNSEGEFSFDRVPVETPVVLESTPFERQFESPVEGKDVTRNLPFSVEEVGSTQIEVRDAESGELVVNLDAILEESGFASITGEDGEAALIASPAGGEKEFTVDIGREDPRYSAATLNPVIVAGETVAYEVELERQTAITEV